MAQTGLIHLYCGDGKGKTTAAMGLALRAAGHGLPVVIAQFLKDGTSGECRILRTLPTVTVLAAHPCGKFSFQEAVKSAKSPGLLVLDEVCAAVSCGFLSKDILLDFLSEKPVDLEVVMTGRAPCDEIRAAADYLSEIKKCRHPYDNAVPAREGIEK